MRELPAPFRRTMIDEMGEEQAAALFEALDGNSPTSIRYNPAKGEFGEDVEGVGGRRIGWSRYGYYLEERPQFTYDSAFHAGCYYVQEASSQFVGHILGDISGKVLLDCCAAPGGKSTLYATLVGREGLVVASEINRGRAQSLCDNVRKWGLGNVAVVNGDAEHVSQCESLFDIVAVDAPCSGEGMFRKSELAREEWSEDGVRLCCERQLSIMQSAWRALKPSGVLLYSTCTFNRSEDEGTLERFAEWCGDDGSLVRYSDVEVDASWGVECGEVGAFQSFRFMPHKAEGEGFFAAVAMKSHDYGGRSKLPKSRKPLYTKLSRAEQVECERWVECPAEVEFAKIGETIYGYYRCQSATIKRLAEGLNVIYSGVCMGEIFKGRLSPDESLAFYVGFNRGVISVVSLGDEDMLRYLRKGELSVGLFCEGLNLVTDVCGHAVGFAKRIGHRVNNRYPNALRIQR